jgi:hypothetical protein
VDQRHAQGLPPGGRVQTVEPSPHRPGGAYVTVLRYLLGDFQPYVYKTDDYGATWRRLTSGSNGVPADHPARVVREDPERAGLLYLGTEFGMFVSFDDGARWQPLQLNLPATPVTDIKVHRGDLVLSTQGRGFYILDDLSPLRQLGAATSAAPAHLFRPRDAYRVRYASRFGGAESARQSSGDPEYPPPGAAVDYWLAAAGPTTLDVLDAEGRVVRSFSSASRASARSRPPRPRCARPRSSGWAPPRCRRARGSTASCGTSRTPGRGTRTRRARGATGRWCCRGPTRSDSPPAAAPRPSRSWCAPTRACCATA